MTKENKTSKAVDIFLEGSKAKDDMPKLRMIFQKYKRMEEALRDIEWLAHGHFCPVCTAEKCQGHFEGCQIGKALKFDPLSVSFPQPND